MIRRKKKCYYYFACFYFGRNECHDVINPKKNTFFFIYYCFDSTNNLKISFDINWEKNEFILSENMGTDSVYVTKYLSEDLFDMSDEEGKL